MKKNKSLAGGQRWSRMIIKQREIMYTVPKMKNTGLSVNKSVQGETIEQKIERIVNNKEPIKDGAPLIYTERKDGAKPEYNIRTDRFEVAIDAMDKVQKSYKARREERAGQLGKKDEKKGDPSQHEASPKGTETN